MKGQTNFNDVDEQEEFGPRKLLPDGKYLFQITEIQDKETKNGDPMISVKLQCIDERYEDIWVWDNIVIPTPNSPGWGIAGRTKHFLHCINEPFQGNFSWDSDNWKYKKVKANVESETYNDKLKNVIKGYILKESRGNPALGGGDGSYLGNENLSELPF